MANTINMQDIMHLNLFSKITRVQTSYCFSYNNILMFCVPRNKLSQALGKQGENLKKMSDKIRKRIRIIAKPNGTEDAEDFFKKIISPAEYKEFKITDNEIIVTAGGKENKAILLGREKRRLEEMKKIMKNFFNKEYKVM
jgi:NusA-like KH domain protein